MSDNQNYAPDVDEIIIQDTYKSIADKILDVLRKVENKTETANRRWIWELLQNAKDTDNVFGQVSVAVALDSDALIFSHNGNPFEVKNLTRLIQQVSSKDSTNADARVSGKFGTGFVSTHLLSRVIEVSGVVKRPEDLRRAFVLKLDRSAITPEAMVGPIEEAMKWVRRQNDGSEFKLLEDYEKNRLLCEDRKDTVFRYPLGNDVPGSSRWEAVREGLLDLATTLPVTLVNIAEIKQVLVRQVGAQSILYRCYRLDEKSAEPVKRYRVDLTDELHQPIASRYFLAYETLGADGKLELRLMAEVRSFSDFTLLPGPEIKQLPKNQRPPTLFRDFPLVGSDTFFFPFQLNGGSFHPYETRDGIVLNIGAEAEHNQHLLKKAVTAALNFTDWLIEHDGRNLYRLANTRVPIDSQTSSEAKRWYRDDIQLPWRAQLLDRRLVETADPGAAIAILRQARVPRYDVQVERETNEVFWQLVADFLGTDRVPRLDLLESWIEALGVVGGDLQEDKTWKEPIFISLADLFEMVAQCETVEALPISQNETGKIAWLNRLFDFASQQEVLGQLLVKHSVVPNQEGRLEFAGRPLAVERSEDLIPAQVLELLELLGHDWKRGLIHRDILLPGHSSEKRGLKEAADLLATELRKAERLSNNELNTFLDRKDVEPLGILIAILGLTTEKTQETAFRRRLVDFASEILGFKPTWVMITEGTAFTTQFKAPFDEAAGLLGQLINRQLEELGTVDAVGEVLKRDKAGTLDWFNNYLGCVSGSQEFDALLFKKGKIIPNWNGELRAYLGMYNLGHAEPEQQAQLPAMRPLVELLARLAPAVAEGKVHEDDWRPRLLAPGISLKLAEPLSYADLGNKLDARTEQIRTSNSYADNSSALMELIRWCNSHRDLASKYLKVFVVEAGTTFYKLKVELNGGSADVLKLLEQSPQQLSQLAEIAGMVGNDENLLALITIHARALADEDQQWKTNFDTGRKVEELFKLALLDTGLETIFNAKLNYQGKGACDFVVRNPSTGKEIYLEVKSFLDLPNPYPLHLAISQARRATTHPEDFILCVVPHPQDVTTMKEDDVRDSLVWMLGSNGNFQTVVADWDEMNKRAKATVGKEIMLEVELGTNRVRVEHALVNQHGQKWDALVTLIKTRLGLSKPENLAMDIVS